jgi:D-glycero-D-manno-heptose 1,7-bisphosphate phosphatase
VKHLEKGGAHLDRIYYCPHHPEGPIAKFMRNCNCRKPSPGMLEEAAQEFGIQLDRSFVIGDRFVDIEAAHRVKAISILVLTGAGKDELASNVSTVRPHFVAENVSAAVSWIMKQL